MNGIGKAKVVALDSNIFIYQFENNPDFISSTQAIFSKLTRNKIQIVTSIVSLIEMLSYPAPQSVLDRIRTDFFSTPGLTVYNVDEAIGLEAARIRRKIKIRLPDAIQLATAIFAKATIFVTNDESMKRFKKIKVVMLKEFGAGIIHR